MPLTTLSLTKTAAMKRQQHSKPAGRRLMIPTNTKSQKFDKFMRSKYAEIIGPDLIVQVV